MAAGQDRPSQPRNCCRYP